MSKPSTTKRRLTLAEREQFRQELIDIARHIFLTEGHPAITIRRITTTAGVTPMAFYWYFDSKDALLAVIWDDLLLEAAQACRQVAEQSPETSRMSRYHGAFIDYWLARRAQFRLIFSCDTPQGPEQLLADPDGSQRHFDYYKQLVAAHFGPSPDGINQATQFRTLASYLVFGFLHSAISQHDHDEATATRQRDLVLEEVQRCMTARCRPA
ncbi:MAG: TetR/AcrR family transcriptional regulator [Burkholderiaceae bacterium]|nr:TetR/AcrR family transcriptional regulator [Burkholderiaceae bacterium]